jgi:ActR/RegA family two-component response regulator
MNGATKTAKEPNGHGAVNEIVLMEDGDVRKKIAAAFESRGCRVRHIPSGDDAIQLAESGMGQFFILDIHMGEGRKNEGLNTLEIIKSIDKDIFVAIYTAYPSWYEDQAKKLDADIVVQKSRDVERDIDAIARKMLPHALRVAGKRRKEKGDAKSAPDDPEYSEEFQINYKAYKKLLDDEGWVAENLNYYVAFVDGEPVGREMDRNRLLQWLVADYPDKFKFYALVQGQDEEIVEDVPSPLFLDD